MKAEESLAGAESEYASGRHNNCANRCYYGCFQAALVALRRAGVQVGGETGQWSHAFVQAQFVGQLVNRRKQYPPALRDVLARGLILRQAADYAADRVTQTQAARALRRTREFVEAIRTEGAE